MDDARTGRAGALRRGRAALIPRGTARPWRRVRHHQQVDFAVVDDLASRGRAEEDNPFGLCDLDCPSTIARKPLLTWRGANGPRGGIHHSPGFGDLRQLRLDAVDWREHVLSITQAKTGRVLTLPLLPDVADALSTYLRTARPATSSRYVFVRHKAPFEPFVAANNLATIMRQALQRVGLDQREGRRGLYLLRHTLASRMLASGSPLKRIGDVLGHASTDTTMEYASVDLTALRRVVISEADVRP